jgi:hypothetical protein
MISPPFTFEPVFKNYICISISIYQPARFAGHPSGGQISGEAFPPDPAGSEFFRKKQIESNFLQRNRNIESAGFDC